MAWDSVADIGGSSVQAASYWCRRARATIIRLDRIEFLSEYLHFVEQGHEVLVTSHRRPVARLALETGNIAAIRLPTQPIAALRRIHGAKPVKPFAASQSLLEDRRRR